MNFWRFLKDQRSLVLAWGFFFLLTIFLIWVYPSFVLTFEFTGYFFLLEFFLLILFLFLKYLKKRDYYKAIAASLLQPVEEENLEEFHTYEEKYVGETLQQLKMLQQENLGNLVEAQQEQQDFLNSWVHEIKIPLAALTLLHESLSFEIPEEKYYQLTDEVGKIHEYVEQVLYYARLDSFSQDYLIQEYSVEKVLKENLKSFANYFIEKHLQLQILGDDFTVLTDQKWLGFILRQIIANSVKYTPNQGKITLQFQQRPGVKELQIIDNGPGIPPEDLPRVFDKGFTGSMGRKEQKSTGLGLYLAHRLTKKLSHQLTITSELGQGTTVTLSFYDVEDLQMEQNFL